MGTRVIWTFLQARTGSNHGEDLKKQRRLSAAFCSPRLCQNLLLSEPGHVLRKHHSYVLSEKPTQGLHFGVRSASSSLDGLKGDTLIDIGSGPSIYQLLSACECFREIIASDYTDQNREEMQRWLRKEPGAFDWSPVVKYVCELEGDREKWVEKEERVRRTIQQVLRCDVTQANPFSPLVVPPADCVLSTLCLEAACKDLPTYSSAMKNVGSLVKPGGHLVLVASLESTFYMAGQNRFFCLKLGQEDVDEAVKGAGFDVVWAQLGQLIYSLDVCNNRSIYALVARKKM